jgi:hypothetical protein
VPFGQNPSVKINGRIGQGPVRGGSGQVLLLAQYPGIDGFLGTRGSVMLDVVVLAMLAVLPLLAISIYLVKVRHQYLLHKKLQLAMGALLLLAVGAFEVDMQFLTEWELRAEPSPYFAVAEKWSCPAGMSLLVHLCFSIPTPCLWVIVIVRAVRNFPHPPLPGPHSAAHKFWGWLATIGMVLTAITGWVFYWLAFVAVE